MGLLTRKLAQAEGGAEGGRAHLSMHACVGGLNRAEAARVFYQLLGAPLATSSGPCRPVSVRIPWQLTLHACLLLFDTRKAWHVHIYLFVVTAGPIFLLFIFLLFLLSSSHCVHVAGDLWVVPNAAPFVLFNWLARCLFVVLGHTSIRLKRMHTCSAPEPLHGLPEARRAV